VLESLDHLDDQNDVIELTKRSTLLWRLKTIRAGITVGAGTVTFTWALFLRLTSIVSTIFVCVSGQAM
jgi:hypothetical protein